ncbi:hypothetical protein FQA39_LY06485 [Lamprigera yunnana]|nr:hypothetical protein FQA39_LY06485 [Lamprigera yunnana]
MYDCGFKEEKRITDGVIPPVVYESEGIIKNRERQRGRLQTNLVCIRENGEISAWGFCCKEYIYNSENWEDSMDEEETEEASLTESASAIEDGGAYADIRKHTDMRGNDSNENEATTESASANKEQNKH